MQTKQNRKHIRLGVKVAILALLLELVALSQQSSSVLSAGSSLVISQVYGGAGCSTAGCSTYKNDYIELFNAGGAAINLTGFSVQYAAAAGSSWQVTALPSVNLAPGQFLLIHEAANANGVNNLPSPDATGSIAMAATAGKVALVNSTIALTGACPLGIIGGIIDFVGYGTTANCFEGAGPAPAPSTTTADVRTLCVDTNNNNANFTAMAPNPRNTASTMTPCSPTAVVVSSFGARELSEGDWSVPLLFGVGVLCLVAVAVWGTRRARTL